MCIRDRLSTVKATGMPDSACPLEVVAVAVAFTVCAPLFWMLAVSRLSVSADAVGQPVPVPPDAADALEQAPVPPPLPNSGVPALPLPPQAVTNATTTVAA